MSSLGATSPLCYKQLGRGWVRQNTTVLYPTLLCWWRHVSATVSHLQVTITYMEENYTEYDHSIGAYSKFSTRSHYRLDCTYSTKRARRGNFSSLCKIQPTTRSRWKFRICTCTMIRLCIGFLYIHFCDLKWRTVAETCRRQHNKVGYKTVVFWRTHPLLNWSMSFLSSNSL